MIIKEAKVVLKIRESHRELQGKWGGQYPHVVEDKIYYELGSPNEVHYAVLDGDIAIKPNNNIVIKNSMAAHNFRVFVDTNPKTPEEERYKAVGGYHVSNNHAELVGYMENQEISLFDPVWPSVPRKVLADDFPHTRPANGLYVFVSPDGLNWKEYHDRPVISMFTKCLDANYEELPLGILGLDWMPSIFFDHNINEYGIYLRANMALGCRHVLYSRSKDLINWSKPRLISCDPPFSVSKKENFYYAAVYPLRDKYIAFPPYFTNTVLNPETGTRSYHDQSTVVMISNDGFNWKTLGKILESEQKHHMEFPHVVSFEEYEEDYALYVHEGFGTPDNKLVRYRIEKKELDNLL